MVSGFGFRGSDVVMACWSEYMSQTRCHCPSPVPKGSRMHPRRDVAKPPTKVVVTRHPLRVVVTIVVGIPRNSDALGVRLLIFGLEDLLDDGFSGSGLRA